MKQLGIDVGAARLGGLALTLDFQKLPNRRRILAPVTGPVAPDARVALSAGSARSPKSKVESLPRAASKGPKSKGLARIFVRQQEVELY